MSYHLCFDVGGTFTDVVLFDDNTGKITVAKVPTDPDEPINGIRDGLQDAIDKANIPNRDVQEPVRGATTLLTNCLIERKGKKTALVTTKGFRDVIEMAREWRYNIYDLLLKMPEPLVPRYLRRGVAERMDKDGNIIEALDERDLSGIIEDLKKEKVEAIAICFLHSYCNPAHEQKAAELVKKLMPGVEVSISSEVVPEMREYTRCSTVVANAYLLPVAHAHFADLRRELEAMQLSSGLYLMHSGGGVVTSDVAERFPVKLVESGPAAGAMAGMFYGKLIGTPNLVTFDMGGTTAKIALITAEAAHLVNDFEVARIARFEKGSGLPLKIQVINMVEIGAGGGSIASVDELGLLKVGPISSGSKPGPACYDRGGTQPTVTDADLVLGYLNPDNFLQGNMRLRQDLAEKAIGDSLASKMNISVLEAAAGINTVVNETMANAARVHLAEEGKDYRQYSLFAFGGAGPVHAIEVARRVGIRKVICPLSAGVLSAIGLMATPIAMDFVRSHLINLSGIDWKALEALDADMVEEAVSLFSSSGINRKQIKFRRTADMRYRGQGYEINVPIPEAILTNRDANELKQAFFKRYEELYKRYLKAEMPIELVNWRLNAEGKGSLLKIRPRGANGQCGDAALKGHRPVYFPSCRRSFQTPVYDHYSLVPDLKIDGPAIVEQRESTTVVGPGDRICTDSYLNLLVEVAEQQKLG
ncbi:MAG: hydantoinase/oxoprolinase family protein [Chloroflexi bacterium]|nr:hydantoinase/oxoprolinase family protein [Chloroflexota bacterium]